MQLFSTGAIVFSTKFSFDPENMKKALSKFAHNRPQTFFSCNGPAAQSQPRIEVYVAHKMVFRISMAP